MPDKVKDTRTPARFTAIPEHLAEVDLKSERLGRFIAILAERKIVVDPTLNGFESFYLDRSGTMARGMAAVADRLPPTVRRAYLSGGLPVPTGMDEPYPFEHADLIDITPFSDNLFGRTGLIRSDKEVPWFSQRFSTRSRKGRLRPS